MKKGTTIKGRGFVVVVILYMLTFYQLYSVYYGVIINENRTFELYDLIVVFPAAAALYGAYSLHKYSWYFLYGYLVYLLVMGIHYIVEGSVAYRQYLSNFYKEYITFHWYDWEMLKSFSYTKGILLSALVVALAILWNARSVKSLFDTKTKFIVLSSVTGFLLAAVTRFI